METGHAAAETTVEEDRFDRRADGSMMDADWQMGQDDLSLLFALGE